MRIRSDQRHSFDVPPEQLWAAMADVDRFRDWWPWLRHFEATALEQGESWRAIVQPPLPYRLSFDLHLHRVEPPHVITADITGDIEGEARIELAPSAIGTELHFTSALIPTNRVLRAVAQVAQPMVRYGHEWVLETGLRQFRARAL